MNWQKIQKYFLFFLFKNEAIARVFWFDYEKKCFIVNDLKDDLINSLPFLDNVLIQDFIDAEHEMDLWLNQLNWVKVCWLKPEVDKQVSK